MSTEANKSPVFFLSDQFNHWQSIVVNFIYLLFKESQQVSIVDIIYIKK